MGQMKDVLRKLRGEREAKQSTIADDLMISRGTYSSYENGITPPTEVCVKLAAYFDVSLEYLLGLTNERRPASGSLPAHFADLSRLAGDDALTASDVDALLLAAARYYRKGAPCGDVPMVAWRDFTRCLTDCFLAASKDDSVALIDSTNAATLAALEIAKMPAIYYKNQKEDGAK